MPLREFMLTLYISHRRPLSEFGSCVWNMRYISDIKLLENVQRRLIKTIYGFENLIYSQRLKDLDLFSVEGKLLRADVNECWKILYNICGICQEDIFVLAQSGITRSHRFKIAYEHSSMDCRRRSIALRVYLPGIPYQTMLLLLKLWGVLSGAFVVT